MSSRRKHKSASPLRRQNASTAAAELAPFLEKTGFSAVLLSEENHHYRLTNNAGGQIDFWGSTRRWCPKGEAARASASMEEMFAALADLTGPAGGAPEGLENRAIATTLFSDASFCQHTGAGGWGGWFKGGHMERGITIGGELPDIFTGSGAAELAAIAMTLREAVALGGVTANTQVMLQSDSQSSLSVILAMVPRAAYSRAKDHSAPIHPAKNPERSMRNSPYLAEIIRIAGEMNLRLIVRHVKGHRGDTTTRTAVNSYCDRRAKEGMRTRRAVLRAAIPA